MFFILHTVPVAFSADSELISNSVLLLPKTLDIQVVTRKSGSGESKGKMIRSLLRNSDGIRSLPVPASWSWWNGYVSRSDLPST